MKYSITIILFLLSCLFAIGQNYKARTLLKTTRKTRLYYIDINDSTATAFQMAKYFDPAETYNSIHETDTLYRQAGNFYVGKTVNIVKEGNEVYLIELKNGKKLRTDTVKNLAVAFNTLNNAFYLSSYFNMSDTLNKLYPLNHHTFRNGFYTWANLTNKETDHVQFRQFARTYLKEVKDSIIRLQDSYVVLTNQLIQNIRTIEYKALKDSLTKLPIDYKSRSWYFGTVVSKVAEQRPEYFFKLAEDDIHNRSLIFGTVDDNKEVIQGLEKVEGHDEIKNEFFKDRHFGKTMPYRILGFYAVVAGLLTWVIISQQ